MIEHLNLLMQHVDMLPFLTTNFFSESVDALKTIVKALGAGLALWGLVNLLEGYGGDNPGAKSQGMKQLMAGGGIFFLAGKIIGSLKDLFGNGN